MTWMDKNENQGQDNGQRRGKEKTQDWITQGVLLGRQE